MRKIQVTAFFWTIIIALPFTALAVVLSGFLSDHLIAFLNFLTSYFQKWVFKGRDMLFEAEIAGLLAGLLIIGGVMLLTFLASNQNRETIKQ
jgi:hypothetical protein